ncbi:hypothetical protein ABZP36_033049, partial [Zizania latifolia]
MQRTAEPDARETERKVVAGLPLSGRAAADGARGVGIIVLTPHGQRTESCGQMHQKVVADQRDKEDEHAAGRRQLSTDE